MSVLDIGCGNGSWALAMAKERPETQVVAADLTPPSIQTPANLTTVMSNAEEDWPFEQKFDFIHGRMLTSAMKDWPSLLSRSWDYLEPGGWLELLDVAPPYRAEIPSADNPISSPYIRWSYIADKGWAKNGIDWSTTSKHFARLQAIGFGNVKEEVFRWPLGEWAETEVERRIGGLTLQNMLGFFRTTALRVLKMDPDLDDNEAQKLKEEAENDLTENCVTNRYYLTV